MVYDKNGVTLKLQCDKPTGTGLTVTLTATNATDNDISGFSLQAAVPKVSPFPTRVNPPTHPTNLLSSKKGLSCFPFAY